MYTAMSRHSAAAHGGNFFDMADDDDTQPSVNTFTKPFRSSKNTKSESASFEESKKLGNGSAHYLHEKTKSHASRPKGKNKSIK
jgi:hypothetical protein